MVCTGNILGVRTYSYTPKESTKRYEGYTLCIAHDWDDPKSVQGCFADTVSISLRDIGGYVPTVGDYVRYSTYRNEKGKLKCGYVLLMTEPSSAT